VIEAIDERGAIVGSRPTMVRIRKNALDLDDGERDPLSSPPSAA
jgi:hypothetical protein